MPLPLIALFIAAFAFGTTEFVIAGVLPDVALGLDVSIPIAGYLVSAYAIGIAVGGPLLTLLTAGVPRKRLLMALLIVFCAGQLACAVAPDFGSMLAIRVAVAAAHGTFFGVAMVVAVGLVAEERRGMAVAFVLAGLTVSNIIGVPVGAAVGTLFGWRATFWSMLGLGIAATLAMAALVPATPGTGRTPAGLRREVGVLRRQQVWTSLFIMLMLMIAQFIPYTYIAPMLREVTGLAPGTIPLVLLLNGVGCTAGVFLGGRLAGGRPMQAMIAMMLLQALVLAVLYAVAPMPVPAVAAITAWGCLNFAIGTLVQTRILTWTADAPNLASSLIPSGFNIGIALAAFLGGLLLDSGFGFRSLPLWGVVSMGVAAMVAFASLAGERRGGQVPPVAES